MGEIWLVLLVVAKDRSHNRHKSTIKARSDGQKWLKGVPGS